MCTLSPHRWLMSQGKQCALLRPLPPPPPPLFFSPPLALEARNDRPRSLAALRACICVWLACWLTHVRRTKLLIAWQATRLRRTGWACRRRLRLGRAACIACALRARGRALASRREQLSLPAHIQEPIRCLCARQIKRYLSLHISAPIHSAANTHAHRDQAKLSDLLASGAQPPAVCAATGATTGALAKQSIVLDLHQRGSKEGRCTQRAGAGTARRSATQRRSRAHDRARSTAHRSAQA